jgi:hypothetical protein
MPIYQCSAQQGLHTDDMEAQPMKRLKEEVVR